VTYSKRDLEQMFRKLHLDLHDAQGKVRDLMKAVASLPIPEDTADLPRCKHCGPLHNVRNERQLAEHMQNVHGEWKQPTEPRTSVQQ
jgi:hypothetical protein